MSWTRYIEDKIKEGNSTKAQLISKISILLNTNKISQDEYDNMLNLINNSTLGE